MISLFLIVSCGGQTGGGKSSIKDVHKGIEGISIEFLENAPPERVYHESDFPAVVTLENIGAYTIENDDAVVLLGIEDQYNKLKRIDSVKIGDSEEEKKVYFKMDGKTTLNPKGGRKIITYDLEAEPIDPQSESRESTIFATICYPYQTDMSTSVCIDTDELNLKGSPKVCDVEDISLSGGQGAPMAVTKVESRMLRKEGNIVPHFIIHVENKGGGVVFRTDDNVHESVKKICSKDAISHEDKNFNTVFVTAYLGPEIDDNLLDCSPEEPDKPENKDKGYVRLIGDKDIIRCTYKGTPISENRGTYKSPLIVKMDYGYTKTVSKTYTIERGDSI